MFTIFLDNCTHYPYHGQITLFLLVLIIIAFLLLRILVPILSFQLFLRHLRMMEGTSDFDLDTWVQSFGTNTPDPSLYHGNVNSHMEQRCHWPTLVPSFRNLRRILILEKIKRCLKEDTENTHPSTWNASAVICGAYYSSFKKAAIMSQGQATVLREDLGRWDGNHRICIVGIVSQEVMFRGHSGLIFVRRVWKRVIESHPCGLLSILKAIPDKSVFFQSIRVSKIGWMTIEDLDSLLGVRVRMHLTVVYRFSWCRASR